MGKSTLFVEKYDQIYNTLAVFVFYIPSVFLGSGLMKDTITIAVVGWLLYSFDQLFRGKHSKKYSIFDLEFTFYTI